MNPKKTPANLGAQLALFSLLAGGASILFCFSPLIQFPLGMAGSTLAILSRLYSDNHFSGQAMAGMITGAIGVVLSLLTFAMVMFVYHVILPNPELGPQYNQILQQFMDGVGNGAIPAL